MRAMVSTRGSRGQVTLAQVAEAAGVSLATASKAMNGRGTVSACLLYTSPSPRDS